MKHELATDVIGVASHALFGFFHARSAGNSPKYSHPVTGRMERK